MSETDRELIEFAAKAAGIVGSWERDTAYRQERYYFNVPYDCQNMLSGFEWNPLQSDTEALRLVVKLGLHLTNSDTDAWATTISVTAIEPLKDDPYTATRRAIVRAAAEIGKAMK